MACERRCTRKSLTREEYKKRTNEGDKFGHVQCAGCHELVFILEGSGDSSCEQFHDIDNILFEETI